jgi:hypothetical protein
MKDFILSNGQTISSKEIEEMGVKLPSDADYEEAERILKPFLEETHRAFEEYKKSHPEEVF